MSIYEQLEKITEIKKEELILYCNHLELLYDDKFPYTALNIKFLNRNKTRKFCLYNKNELYQIDIKAEEFKII